MERTTCFLSSLHQIFDWHLSIVVVATETSYDCDCSLEHLSPPSQVCNVCVCVCVCVCVLHVFMCVYLCSHPYLFIRVCVCVCGLALHQLSEVS